MEMEPTQHRRAQIINKLAELFEMLTPVMPESESLENEARLPMTVKTVQKRFVHWTALDRQDALPAILLSYGDGGSVQDSDVVGFIDETFPISVTAVMKEGTPTAEDAMGNPVSKDLIDQASDMHYSIGQLVNGSSLGVEGVNPERTRIASWRGSEGAVTKFEIIRFRVVVVHRYLATENV